ncbi:DEAD/DEAH box helicase [Actinokineospora bangkokensis]|uniref:Damage-inducible protein n=1 Tax=Actinokineospora bangkokensis TaxID=1193682 RepID=A0A1Q9LC59_9PSEU|nr:type ISP restriction/modification enzyme [Actinokineospora bangkokensis]OLR89612.1 damage-inducible protein [Actinokineospora bangkokensis]
MSTTIHDILHELRASALDERDKGEKFERLMQGYFRADPEWALQFSDVWLWSEWPGRDGRPDTGIDLVAVSRETGERTAIQCKFYAPHHSVQKSDIDSFFTASGKIGFTRRIIVSTSDKWSKNAEEALADQQVPTQRLDVSILSESVVDWSRYSLATPSVMPTRKSKSLRPHQQEALDTVIEKFEHHDRGQLIMACGTGKTFTSLKIAEEAVGSDGTVLFLVPSISLLSQTLREWTQEAAVELRPFAVCSDVRVGRKQTEDMGVVDLAEPATTNAAKLLQRLGRTSPTGKMTVIFSTYQSIQVVADAQAAGLGAFDMVICDEAHRTTGVTLAGEDESAFVRVHDQKFLKAKKRLYMTATPRIYRDETRVKAAESAALVTDMNKIEDYGPEFHRLGFGEAVDRGLLSDYKVLVLAVDESKVSRQFQSLLADENNELKLDDVAKLVGCWNGLAKRGLDEQRLHVDAEPMRRAVAFAENIAVSQRVAQMLEVVGEQMGQDSDEDDPLVLQAQHVDGTFNVLERNRRLDWLKADQDAGTNECRILTNARCLSEGVDVPALDAVLFLNPRNSVVDVVQSVGRVMRLSRETDKKYGYVILPIGVPVDMPPEVALADNKKYKVVWQVLQALRAHDERFNAMINKIELNRNRDDKLQVIGIGFDDQERRTDNVDRQTQLALAWSDEWRDAIYAKIVTKVGEKAYWEDWARDIAKIAEAHITRIKALLDDDSLGIHPKFEKFHAGLRGNLNDGITRNNAIEMLAQHIITKPVFDALFEGYAFAQHNPVSLVMQDMLDALDNQGIEKESESLDKFYNSVRMRAEGIDNAEGKQRIITELYEKFFKNAFPKAAESLGIVYTPIEIVDFILRSVEHLLDTEFGASLNDAGVHVLDPFAGTGTFIVRLLQSGIISPGNLLHKYTQELHANEINLLAYYVAAVNIEATFHGLKQEGTSEYLPFEGIVLTDTFQMHENDDTLDAEVFTRNNDRVVRQKATDIRVIVGNPPYSAGQTSANDDNANLKYPTLDARIERSYGRNSSAKLKNSLYDSYIRAIRWASDRVGNRGIVSFVSNGGFVDSNAADGLRKCLIGEFDKIYVYNLRGNQRTAGELSRKEGGKIFGGGSRATVAIVFLIKTEQKDNGVPATLYYRDIGDCLSREQKLEIVNSNLLGNIEWKMIQPNEYGDWINQRRGDYTKFTPLTSKDGIAMMRVNSGGLNTSRDAWAYNFSQYSLKKNVQRSVRFFNSEVDRFGKSGLGAGSAGTFVDRDPVKFSWDVAPLKMLTSGRKMAVNEESYAVAMYRPFMRTHVYRDPTLINRTYQLAQVFPDRDTSNLGFYIVGTGSDVPFSVLMVDAVPDRHVTGAGSGGSIFPRYLFERTGSDGQLGFDVAEDQEYRRIDNMHDATLQTYRKAYGSSVSIDDIFYYVYGLLHSREYREVYASDLKKLVPHIPMVTAFYPFSEAGRELSRLHLGYETVDPYPLNESVAEAEAHRDTWRVQKMVFAKGSRVDGKATKDRSKIVYNSQLTLSGIPDDTHRYMIGSRSALEWILDRYQVKKDKLSGIVNDPNDWAEECGNPRYIIDLIKRIVTVSVETMKIVDSLPPLDIIDPE